MLASGAFYGAIAVVGLFVGLYLRDRQVSGGGVPEGDGEHRELVVTAKD